MTEHCNGMIININTISGGIVNFGGAYKIAPVTISKSTSGSGQSTGTTTNTEAAGTLESLLPSL